MKEYRYITKSSVEKKIKVLQKRAERIKKQMEKIYSQKEKYDTLYTKLEREYSNLVHMKIAGLNGHLHSMEQEGTTKLKVARY